MARRARTLHGPDFILLHRCDVSQMRKLSPAVLPPILELLLPFLNIPPDTPTPVLEEGLTFIPLPCSAAAPRLSPISQVVLIHEEIVFLHDLKFQLSLRQREPADGHQKAMDVHGALGPFCE